MNATASFEDIVALVAIDNVQPETLARANAFENLLAEPAQVDNDGLDTAVFQCAQVPFEQWFPMHLDQ